MQEKCSIDGCGRTKAKRGWCNTHYQRWRRHGDPDIVLQIRGSECAVESCSDHAVGQGYCNRHYQRLMKHGDPEYVAPKPKCQIAGCEKPHVGKGEEIPRFQSRTQIRGERLAVALSQSGCHRLSACPQVSFGPDLRIERSKILVASSNASRVVMMRMSRDTSGSHQAMVPRKTRIGTATAAENGM